jgi:hypothetical protein
LRHRLSRFAHLITTIGLEGPLVDALCIAILAARVVQSCVHISHVQTDAFVAVSFLALIVMAARHGISA